MTTLLCLVIALEGVGVLLLGLLLRSHDRTLRALDQLVVIAARDAVRAKPSPAMAAWVDKLNALEKGLWADPDEAKKN